MPAQSQQQQKLFGLALAFKRGEVKSSEVSDEIKGIADRMSEKEIEDFAATKRKGLPKMKEQLRKIVREIMREQCISEINEESVNEAASKEAMGIAALTGTRGSAVEEFINKHELDGGKLFRSIKKANLRGRLNFVSALVGKDGNPNQKLFNEVIGIVEKNINDNIPIKKGHVIDITGPRVIQNIICGMFGVRNQDGWLIGDMHPRVGFEGDEYEFVYTKVPFPKLKTDKYQKLQQKYKRENYQVYNRSECLYFFIGKCTSRSQHYQIKRSRFSDCNSPI